MAGAYDAFARNADEERTGVSLREAFIRLLVLVWQDNEADEVEAMWRQLAQTGGRFTADALAVIDAVLADPPTDLPELIAQHGWVPQIRDAADGRTRPHTQAEAVTWLTQARARLGAIRDQVQLG